MYIVNVRNFLFKMVYEFQSCSYSILTSFWSKMLYMLFFDLLCCLNQDNYVDSTTFGSKNKHFRFANFGILSNSRLFCIDSAIECRCFNKKISILIFSLHMPIILTFGPKTKISLLENFWEIFIFTGILLNYKNINFLEGKHLFFDAF